MALRVKTLTILLASLLSLTVNGYTIRCTDEGKHSDNDCSAAVDELQGNFQCGADTGGYNIVSSVKDCSIGCATSSNKPMTVNSEDVIAALNRAIESCPEDKLPIIDFDGYNMRAGDVIYKDKRQVSSCNPNYLPTASHYKTDNTDNSVDDNVSIAESETIHNTTINERRDTRYCGNCGKISRDKFGPTQCAPAYSRGYRSAHNCKTKEGGKTYLCVQSGIATCYTIAAAFKLNFEGGECFI